MKNPETGWRKMYGVVETGEPGEFRVVEVEGRPDPAGGFHVRRWRGHTVYIDHAPRLYATQSEANKRMGELTREAGP